jgi:large subunit ribosomal protein L13
MKRNIHKINAEGKILGRMAVEISGLLRGKQKSDFAPNKDIGDFVEVENAGEVKLTGKKPESKKYFRHSGFMGGLKEDSIKKVLEEDPSKIVIKAVRGMMPKNKLSGKQIKRLKFK